MLQHYHNTYKNSQESIGLFVTQLHLNLIHILNEENKNKYTDHRIHPINQRRKDNMK